MRITRIALLLFLVRILAAQEPAPAVVEGRVVAAVSSEPLVRAIVELRTDAGIAIQTTTETDGKFAFVNVRPGQYRLVSTLPGYVRSEYVAQNPRGLYMDVGAGTRLSGLQLSMVRAGLIAGRVTDRGKPIPGALVSVMKPVYEGGRRVLKTVLSAATNDLGEYSIFWIPPGQYYVVGEIFDIPKAPPPILMINPGGGDNPVISTAPSGLVSMSRAAVGPPFPPPQYIFSRSTQSISDIEMHAPIFSPDTTDWESARAIDIAPGDELRTVDLKIDPVRALHVRGTVTGFGTNPQGLPLPVQVAMFPFAAPTSTPLTTLQAAVNGSFDIPRVTPGVYMLRVISGNLSSRLRVDVRDRDVNGVSVALVPNFAIPGRVLVDSQEPLPEGWQANIGFQLVSDSADLSSSGFVLTPRSGSNFTLANVQAGNYRPLVFPFLGSPRNLNSTLLQQFVLSPALQNAYVASVNLNGVDILNNGVKLMEAPSVGLTVTLRTDGRSLEGRVLNGQSSIANATVVLIPENGQRFHIAHKNVTSDASGRFKITGIAPGDYKLFAWESVESGAWQNEAFVRQYESQAKLLQVEKDVSGIDVQSIR